MIKFFLTSTHPTGLKKDFTPGWREQRWGRPLVRPEDRAGHHDRGAVD